MSLDIDGIFTTLLSVENGIFAGGWMLAVFLLRKVLANKDAVSDTINLLQQKNSDEIRSLRESHAQEIKNLRTAHAEELKNLRENNEKRIEETEDALSEQLREATQKVNELNAAHIQIITEMADKRIEDMRSVTEDYNAMAESVRTALEKIAAGLSRKR
jgi:DNA anti-recombination protein RmuC